MPDASVVVVVYIFKFPAHKAKIVQSNFEHNSNSTEYNEQPKLNNTEAKRASKLHKTMALDCDMVDQLQNVSEKENENSRPQSGWLSAQIFGS